MKPTMKRLAKQAVLATTLVAISGLAQAHYLWIERDHGAANVYFGEWQIDLREDDGKVMKAIQGVTAYSADKTPLVMERKFDHWTIAQPGKGDVRVFDEVMHRGTKVVYDIKGGRKETVGVAGFELVPIAPDSNTLTLMLDGKPLPKTEVKVYGPPKWEKAFTSDDAGRITIETPWKGFYVIRAAYDDDSSGEFEGAKFDKITNVTILSFTVAKGAPWPVKGDRVRLQQHE
jgi:hypothetical protein